MNTWISGAPRPTWPAASARTVAADHAADKSRDRSGRYAVGCGRGGRASAADVVVAPQARPSIHERVTAGRGLRRPCRPRRNAMLEMRSASTSAMPRTPLICRSSISWTPMNPGPTKSQWACLGAKARSLSACGRTCSWAATWCPTESVRPGTVIGASASDDTAVVDQLALRVARCVVAIAAGYGPSGRSNGKSVGPFGFAMWGRRMAIASSATARCHWPGFCTMAWPAPAIC